MVVAKKAKEVPKAKVTTQSNLGFTLTALRKRPLVARCICING
jgi:hypothetical protein